MSGSQRDFELSGRIQSPPRHGNHFRRGIAGHHLNSLGAEVQSVNPGSAIDLQNPLPGAKQAVHFRPNRLPAAPCQSENS